MFRQGQNSVLSLQSENINQNGYNIEINSYYNLAANDFILLLAAMAASAFFSLAETTFVTFDKLKIIAWTDLQTPFTRHLKFFYPRTDRYIITCLIGNNIANVAFSSLSVVYLLKTGWPPVLIILISTFIILTFSEVIPKAVGLAMNSALIKPVSFFMLILYIIFFPAAEFLSLMYKILFPHTAYGFQPNLSRDHLRRLMLSQQAGMEREEAKLAGSVLAFASAKMRQVMTPRLEMAAAPLDTAMETIQRMILDSGHSKIVIYEENIDNIRGYIHAFDLMHSGITLSDVLRPVVFVSEFTPVIEGLEILKKKETGLLIVLDEYGGVDGLVTIEDIAEEIFGEIEDEHDRPRFRYKALAEGKYLLDGRAEIDDVNREYHLHLQKEEGVETVGGWVVTKLGRIPEAGDFFKLENLKIEIVLADKRRIVQMKVEKLGEKD